MLEEYMNVYDDILKDMADKMFLQKIENNIFDNFINTMIYHHEASILMCKNIINHTKNIDIKNISNNIVKRQNIELEKIKELNVIEKIESITSIEEYMINYREIITNMIFKMYYSPKYENIDLDFIEEIIPHNEGFILMCENILKYKLNEKYDKLIKEMIKNSKDEIRKLTEIKETLK